jgi:multiple antibiotic resistance protein
MVLIEYERGTYLWQYGAGNACFSSWRHTPQGPSTDVSEILKNIFLIVSAIFPVVNPLGASPFFLTLTASFSTAARRALARRIALNSFFLLIGSYFIGSHILAFFGISLPVVQVGGGLIVISTGWSLLKRRDENERSEVKKTLYPQDTFRQAFYPMTLPLTVGPGSISVALTLGANAPHSGIMIMAIPAAIAGSLIISLTIFICYGFADRLASILGPTVMSVIMRLSSFLLVCIGVQIMWNGMKALLLSLLPAGH